MSGTIKLRPLLLSIALTLGAGLLASYLSDTTLWQRIRLPAFAPSQAVFSAVWCVIYVATGYALYRVITQNSSKKQKSSALWLYIFGMALNFLWSPIFFNMENYSGALIMLILLFFVTAITTAKFFGCDKVSGWIFTAYLVWQSLLIILNIAVMNMN